MIILEKTFTSGDGGFAQSPLTYTQIVRTAKAAVYSRTTKDGVLKDYEVFEIRILPKGTQIFDKITEDDEEKYPSTGKFGITAWSFHGVTALAGAMKKYEELNKSEAQQAIEDEAAAKSIELPIGEFTVGELADKNSITYIHAATFVKEAVAANSVKFLREERRQAKGKPSKIYSKT